MNLEPALAPIDPYRRDRPNVAKPEGVEFDFEDVLDVINPLQHLPGIGWLYREITGDLIQKPAALAGGALYGGPIGFAGALLTAAFESLAGASADKLLQSAFDPVQPAKAASAYQHAAALAGDENRR